MGSNIGNSAVKYNVGTYENSIFRIGGDTFIAQVEVFRSEQIDRSRPTAFAAGHAYETDFGTHPVDQVIYKAQALGSILGKIYTVITGHCSGVPPYIANASIKNGGQVIGISAFPDKEIHLNRWRKTKFYRETNYKLKPEESASIAVHSGKSVWHRDIYNNELTNDHRQVVYVVGGHTGSNHEVEVALAHDAVIGMLLGVGGVSGAAYDKKRFLESANIKHNIVEDTDPQALVQKVMELDKKLKEQDENDELITTPLTEFLDSLESRIIVSPSP